MPTPCSSFPRTEVQSLLDVALDPTYIAQKGVDFIDEPAAPTHARVDGFIHYLLSNAEAR